MPLSLYTEKASGSLTSLVKTDVGLFITIPTHVVVLSTVRVQYVTLLVSD